MIKELNTCVQNTRQKMATLYNYFKREQPKEEEDEQKEIRRAKNLPDPEGQLSLSVPASLIASANDEVMIVSNTKRTRGSYDRFSPEEKATIAKRAIENGITKTVRKYNDKLADRKLKESTVRTWISEFNKQMELKRSTGIELTSPVTKLEPKRRGRPLLLGETLDMYTHQYVAELRKSGAVINTDIVSAAAIGIVKKFDANLLQVNGGHISCSREWAKGLLHRMGYVKRRSNTKAKVTVEEFESAKAQFNYDIEVIRLMEDVPDDLIINWDHTGLNYVPASNWTMAKEGSARVEITGLGDKRQITAVLSCTLSGNFLPPQVIYSGKTSRCLPCVAFPKTWHITFTENHWANERTTIDYVNKILLPYIQETRCKLSLSCNHSALVIFDRFKGQCTSTVLQLLTENNIKIVVVPANLTDRLQPLDISVNKSVKDFLRRQFSSWYSEQVCSQMEQSSKPQLSQCSVDLSLSSLKPLGVKWLISMFDYFKEKNDIITNGFIKAGVNPKST